MVSARYGRLIIGTFRHFIVDTTHIQHHDSLKGYLRCNGIFLFRRKIMFCSQDIQVFVFLTIP